MRVAKRPARESLSARLFADWNGDPEVEADPLTHEEILIGLFHKDGFTRGVAVDAFCARFPVTEQFAKTFMQDNCYWVREAVVAGLRHERWTKWKARLIKKLFAKGDDLWVLRAGIATAYLGDQRLLDHWHGYYQDPDPTLVVIASGLVDFLKGVDGEPEERILGAIVRGYEHTYAIGALNALLPESEPVPVRIQALVDRIEARFDELPLRPNLESREPD